MPARGLQSAREIAAQTLQRCDPARDYAGPILDRLLGQTDEKQRATDLVYGTIRNLNALDAVIARLSGRRPDRIAGPLLSILRVGVYELAYSPATPVYCVVNEAVDIAAKVGGKKQTGFVNAVLREIVRHIANRDASLAVANPQRTLIREPGAGCEFDTDFLPDPHDSASEYLSTCFSLPRWLAADWLAEFGPEHTRQICLGSNRKPSLHIRINPLRAKPQDLLARFEQAGVKAEPAPVPDMLRIAGPQAVTELPGFAEGLFMVQDLSASQAVRALQPQSGWSILDLCSAPGTKTTQLAELTHDAASILATDIDPKRLERVQENISRLGLKSVTIIPYDQLEQGTADPFDAILLDAPCSNTGVLARRVEARFRLKPDTVAELAATQRDLLDKAAPLLKPTGRICYSTCSIQKAENQDVICDFLATHKQFSLAYEQLTLPAPAPADHDGTYVAVLQDQGSIPGG
jgi:16S rRNA (cytosine967-C5)-methyltransferase